MDIKKFVLSYYENATIDFHIKRIQKPKEALELHTHDYFQIYYIKNGKILHHLESSAAELSAGDVFILPPDIPHYIQELGGEVDFYSLSFTPSYFQSLKENNKLILDFLYYLRSQSIENIHPKFSLSYDDAVFCETLIKRALEEFTGKKTGKDELIKECVSAVLSIFARSYFEQQAEQLISEENRQLVMHSIEYLKNHFDEDLTLSEIVRLSAMSKTCFCTIFSSLVGMPFKEYLNRCRIEKAAELIASGEKICIVGNCCGYSEFSTFYRNFKKYMGVSPSEFKRRNNFT